MKKNGRRSLTVVKARIAPAPQRIRPPAKKADSFYHSAEWRALIADLVIHRGRRCEKCGRYRDDHGRPIRVYGDHIVELKDGGPPLDARNVQLLCAACHLLKTAAARAVRTAMRYRKS
jgi:5-methylcytosine-specific restriction enzyme A